MNRYTLALLLSFVTFPCVAIAQTENNDGEIYISIQNPNNTPGYGWPLGRQSTQVPFAWSYVPMNTNARLDSTGWAYFTIRREYEYIGTTNTSDVSYWIERIGISPSQNGWYKIIFDGFFPFTAYIFPTPFAASALYNGPSFSSGFATGCSLIAPNNSGINDPAIYNTPGALNNTPQFFALWLAPRVGIVGNLGSFASSFNPDPTVPPPDPPTTTNQPVPNHDPSAALHDLLNDAHGGIAASPSFPINSIHLFTAATDDDLALTVNLFCGLLLGESPEWFNEGGGTLFPSSNVWLMFGHSEGPHDLVNLCVDNWLFVKGHIPWFFDTLQLLGTLVFCYILQNVFIRLFWFAIGVDSTFWTINSLYTKGE